jgi:hypothetical protein
MADGRANADVVHNIIIILWDTVDGIILQVLSVTLTENVPRVRLPTTFQVSVVYQERGVLLIIIFLIVKSNL